MGTAGRLLILALAAGVGTWWLGPQAGRSLEWAIAPGCGLRLDALNLLFLTLFLALPPYYTTYPVNDGIGEPRRVRGGRLMARMGLGGVALAAGTPVAIAGLTLVAAGRSLAMPGEARTWLPATLPSALLLPVALSGAFDSRPPPGAPVLALPWPLVGLALLAAITAVLAGQGAAPGPSPQPAAQGPGFDWQWRSAREDDLLAALYTAAGLLPLLRSLAAGPWDGWAQGGALAGGLLLLAAAGVAALEALRDGPDLPPSFSQEQGERRALPIQRPRWGWAVRAYLAGALLVGLGLGTPGAVAGGVVLLVTGLITHTGGAGAPGGRLVGLVALAGLPPTAGFAGLWLLGGAAAAAGAWLPLVAVPVAGWLVALAGLRATLTPGSSPKGEGCRTARPPDSSAEGDVCTTQATSLPYRGGAGEGAAGAVGLLLAGLLPIPLLDAVLRPALNTLAAGLPALAEVQSWPGVGLIWTRTNLTEAVWPAWGLSAALLLTLAGTEAGARLAGWAGQRRSHPRA